MLNIPSTGRWPIMRIACCLSLPGSKSFERLTNIHIQPLVLPTFFGDQCFIGISTCLNIQSHEIRLAIQTRSDHVSCRQKLLTRFLASLRPQPCGVQVVYNCRQMYSLTRMTLIADSTQSCLNDIETELGTEYCRSS